MSDEKKPFVPAELPKCLCFDFADESDWARRRCAEASSVSAEAAAVLWALAREHHYCPIAMPYLLDLMIIGAAVYIATDGTILEQGTEDAEREVDRVLTGIEARLKMRSHEMHVYAREHAITAETMKAMRERDGGVH